MKFSFGLLLILLWSAVMQSAAAQSSLAGDTLKSVEIIKADRLTIRKTDNAEVQILAGNVQLRQGTTLFSCDSCIINNQTKVFEAFGKVHINDDTTNVYANYLKYYSLTEMANLRGAVKLTDGHGTLTTDELDYDVARKIGTYNNGGKVVTKKSVLTSKEGVYYTDTKDIYFKQQVELKDPAYYLKSDSLLYNSETQVATFIAETFLRDSANRTIRTTAGTYDMRSGTAQFIERTAIEDKGVRIVGDQIASDDATGLVQILGNGVLIDTAQGISILANEIFADRNKEAYLATRKPLMIIKQETDSIYVTADTLFTARLSDRFPVKKDTAVIKDSVSKGKGKPAPQLAKKGPVKDSTDRYFEAFKNVRIFADSLQTVSDSLFYSFKDSVFRLYQAPLVWANNSQISGDTIYLHTQNKKAKRIQVFENSFLINQMDPGVFNQVKSTRLDGFFINGVIDSVRARGSTESVYFLRNEDSTYTGINQTSSDVMDVMFVKGDLNKVVLRSNVKGTLWPASEEKRNALRLATFNWQEARRPKTKYELFE
jgi:lipopolysaccharide transport protein LptA